MPAEEKKGITVKVDAGLHAEVKQYIESHGMTMAEFVSLALHDELHPKFQTKEDAGNMRTLAFQVPEDLFQKIKDYLRRNNMTQKEFVIGLIETELERDLAQRERVNEAFEGAEEPVEEVSDELDETAPVGDFADGSDGDEPEDEPEDESEDEPEDESEDEEQGFTLGM